MFISSSSAESDVHPRPIACPWTVADIQQLDPHWQIDGQKSLYAYLTGTPLRRDEENGDVAQPLHHVPDVLHGLLLLVADKWGQH